MAANYDRLFEPPEGGEIRDDAAAEPDFDIDSGFDISSPAAPPPTPTSPPRPNGHAPPPMPVDWNNQPPPARPETPRPPMPVDYDRLFEPTEGAETPDEATSHQDYDVDSPSPTPPMPTSTPWPNGHEPPPMPVNWTAQPPPAASRRRPMPVGRAAQAPPARPEPPTPPTAGAQVPTQRSRQARHMRDGQSDTPGSRAKSQHSHRVQDGNAKPAGRPSVPLRPSAPPAGSPSPAARYGDAPTAERNGPGRAGARVASQVASTSTVTTADQREKSATADLGVKPTTKRPAARMVSRRGWRRWVHALTRINFGLSRDEKYEVELKNRIRRTVHGSYEIGVLGLKGGAGKTSVTAALGSVFAQVRGDRILVVDADPVSGNLADRVGRQTAASIADLVANRALSHYNDIRAHTSMNAANLEVLGAANYNAARPTLSEEDWKRAVALVPRYYNLVLADCGADLFGPAARGVLAAASGLVIMSSASVDGARQAAVALDWLRYNGHLHLLSRACVVINHVVPGESKKAVPDLVAQFQPHVQPGRVIVLPWDEHIAAGTEVKFALLSAAYQRKIIELAAALSDDFDRGERR
jgi:MinD-like ATPase involved in chromosome partitioning or flagellar assembly